MTELCVLDARNILVDISESKAEKQPLWACVQAFYRPLKDLEEVENHWWKNLAPDLC